MREIDYRTALREAMDEEMEKDDKVFIIGEDLCLYGGAFRVTQGLYEKYGPDRVRSTPISETAIVGAAVGGAMTGYRPIAEIMFIDFITLAMDQIVNQAAKIKYMTGDTLKCPVVIRTQGGSGRGIAAQHSQSLEAWFFHVPGLKVVMPSTPYDAKGLLKTAIADDDPVMFIEHKMLYLTKGDVPEDEYYIPFGEANILREGTDITIVSYSLMALRSLEAANELESEGISCEVIDLRTLVPMDKNTILNSVNKTNRLVIVHEACKRGGVGGEISAMVAEEAFDCLDAPIKRVAGLNTAIPYNSTLEKMCVPTKDDIMNACREIVSR